MTNSKKNKRISFFTKNKILRKIPKKFFAALVIIPLAIFFYFFIIKDIPSATRIDKNNYSQSTNIYDRNSKLLYSIYNSKNQTFVSLDKIPKEMQQATIAIEDKDFYKHGAVDFRGIARAFLYTFFKKQTQGGSTITQQLVKNSLLTMEQTYTRKVKEVILSFIVETIYNKDRILEMYLNQVSYGGTAWGVQAASYVYFNKPVSQLNLAESAFLAGLPEAPSLYSPFGSHPEVGKQRQEETLRKMREQGYITQKQEKEALGYQLSFSKIKDKINAPHFVFYIKDLLVQRYGQRIAEQGGLNVITSLDLDLQTYAQDVIATEVADLKPYNVSNGASVVTDPRTGEILAMVGGHDYFDSANDGNVNVTISKRQPGSSIKPINYAVGLIKGYTAATPFIDKQICFPNPGGKEYCPVNYDGKFHGVVQMRNALGNSFNIPAVKMLKLNTVEDMIATASAMGITTFDSPDKYGLSLTLGGGEVTMLNMVEAFGVFANNGYRVNINPILKVTDNKGKVLEEYKPEKSSIFGKKVLPDGVSFIMSQMLSDNGARAIEFGENSLLRIKNYPIPVKTGTTNDLRDNWTIGYTPNFVVATWVGNNNNKAMSGLASGITGAAPIWNKIMSFIIKDNPPKALIKPDSVVGREVCATSGLVPPPEGTADRCPVRYEYFIKGTEPKQVDPGRTKVYIDKTTHDLPKQGQTDNLEEKDEIIVTDPTGDRYCLSCPHPETPTPTPTN